jgi:hypothetical protein
MGAEMFHAGGRTYGQTRHSEAKVDLRNFANAPLIVSTLSLHCNVDHYSTQLAATRHQLVLHITQTKTTLKGAESYSAGQKITCSYEIVFRKACNCAPSCVWQIYTVTVRLI